MHPRTTRVSPPTSDELEPSLRSKHTPPWSSSKSVWPPPTPGDVDPLLEIKCTPPQRSMTPYSGCARPLLEIKTHSSTKTGILQQKSTPSSWNHPPPQRSHPPPKHWLYFWHYPPPIGGGGIGWDPSSKKKVRSGPTPFAKRQEQP